LTAQLRDRGVPDAPTFADRRALLLDWLDPPTESAVRSPEVENTTHTPNTRDSKDDEEHLDPVPGTESPPVDDGPPEERTPPATPQQSSARSVAGAHPSVRLDRPEENVDTFEIDDLPEVEDLDQAEDLDDTPPTGPGDEETTERPAGPPPTLKRRPRFAPTEEEPHVPPTKENDRGTEPLFSEPSRSPSDA